MRPSSAVLLLSLLLLQPLETPAAVLMHDAVAVAGRVVTLKALTRGRIFPEGGRLVDFYLEDRHIGRTLSGGDGYAYMEYPARRAGLWRVEARSGPDSDEGTLLVVEKDRGVVVVEVEGALMRSILTFEPRQGSVSALKGLLDGYRVIYISTILGRWKAREWLRQRGFPPSATLSWEGPELIEELKEGGLKLRAVVASPQVVEASAGRIEERFSFGETEGGTVVGDWKEVLESLRKKPE